MDTRLILKIVKDREILDIKRLKYKYPDIDMRELAGTLDAGIFEALPLVDFNGQALRYIKSLVDIDLDTVKLLSCNCGFEYKYAKQILEDEISSTMEIENIATSRDSIRRMIEGENPLNIEEKQILGLKMGFEYICKPENEINENNLHELFQLAIGEFLPEKNKPEPGSFYRNDAVYIMSHKLEHTGLGHDKLPLYMKSLIEFINIKDGMPDLVKAAVLHCYFGYIHPYFDGNGRMARLIHQWYLLRSGYPSTLLYPFSSLINDSKKAYYRAFSLVEENAKILGVLDATPFIIYFNENIYSLIRNRTSMESISGRFNDEMEKGSVTEKERDLWLFAMASYGEEEFSTKRLEKDFGNAAYATIRSFVLKFEKLGLLTGRRYSNKVKYRIRNRG